ncbi:MAG: ABC transporter permease subunit [Hyphomicrobiales bacterium]|nr:ABC transporter permease subunit [Hyphomicrobiales bacterium]
MSSWLRSALSIAGFFAVWEFVARMGVVPSDYFPTPTQVAATLVDEIRRGEIVAAFLVTLLRALVGASAAVALAVATALLTARYDLLRRAFDPIAELLRPLPPAAITPLAIFFLGLGWKLYAFILVFACFWPVYLNAAQALGAAPAVQIQTARSFGYSEWDILARVRLPAGLPTIFTGVRMAASIALIAAIAAEMIAGRDGLGFYLMDAGLTLRVPETFAGLVMAMIAGLIVNAIVLALLRLAVGWHARMAALAGAQ